MRLCHLSVLVSRRPWRPDSAPGHGKDTSDHGYHGICLRRMDHGVRFAGLADFLPSCSAIRWTRLTYLNVKGQSQDGSHHFRRRHAGCVCQPGFRATFATEVPPSPTHRQSLTIAGCVTRDGTGGSCQGPGISLGSGSGHLQLPCSAACSSDMLSA